MTLRIILYNVSCGVFGESDHVKAVHMISLKCVACEVCTVRVTADIVEPVTWYITVYSLNR